MSQRQEELLEAIDGKLAALLAITVDQYLRDTGVAESRHASVDSMLRGVGIRARDIAALLGKTERAVNMKIKADEDAKKPRKKKAAKAARDES